MLTALPPSEDFDLCDEEYQKLGEGERAAFERIEQPTGDDDEGPEEFLKEEAGSCYEKSMIRQVPREDPCLHREGVEGG